MAQSNKTSKTLATILSDIQSAAPVSHNDLYYTSLVLHLLQQSHYRTLIRLHDLLTNPEATTPIDLPSYLIAQLSQCRTLYNRALDLPPQEFLGSHNDPASPSYRHFC